MKPRNNYLRWSKQRIKELTEYYKDANLSVEEISKRIGRTENSIRLKASRLKLKRHFLNHLSFSCYGKEFDPEECIKDKDCRAWLKCSNLYYSNIYGVD